MSYDILNVVHVNSHNQAIAYPVNIYKKKKIAPLFMGSTISLMKQQGKKKKKKFNSLKSYTSNYLFLKAILLLQKTSS
jgi:hypothetical protein